MREDLLNKVHDYMTKNLSPDALLVWGCITNPPPYIEENAKFGKITNILLAEFFNLPRTRSSVKYIGELREDIRYWIDKAREELVIQD